MYKHMQKAVALYNVRCKESADITSAIACYLFWGFMWKLTGVFHQWMCVACLLYRFVISDPYLIDTGNKTTFDLCDQLMPCAFSFHVPCIIGKPFNSMTAFALPHYHSWPHTPYFTSLLFTDGVCELNHVGTDRSQTRVDCWSLLYYWTCSN